MPYARKQPSSETQGRLTGARGHESGKEMKRCRSWEPTLTRPFPNGSTNAASWLGRKILCIILPSRRIAAPKVLWCVRFLHDYFCIAILAWFVHERSSSEGNFHFILISLESGEISKWWLEKKKAPTISDVSTKAILKWTGNILFSDRSQGIVIVIGCFIDLSSLIIKITISSIAIGLKNSYFPLILLSGCYRTVCYRTPCYRTGCYRTVQEANHIQSCSQSRPILLSLVWLQTELDSTQSYYHYE